MSGTSNSGNQSAPRGPPLSWVPLEPLRETLDSSKLCISDGHHPRLAKDKDYADSVLKAWRRDVKSLNDSEQTVGSTFVYHRSEDGAELLNGYIVASSILAHRSNSDEMERKVPAVLFFHTGAGPQDIFLRWKADVLVRQMGCVVLIADIISDAEGYAWSDRERYDAARRNVLATSEEEGQIARWKLRQSITAALDALKGMDIVDSNRIAGLGWCMGGHPLLELGLMQEQGVKALVSYHGVFDGIKDHALPTCSRTTATDEDGNLPGSGNTQVLICNGMEDPFVAQDDIAKTKTILQTRGFQVEVINFDGVKHGFTNPAQDYNPSDAFAFNEHAAKTSWESTIQLLRNSLM